MNMDIRNQIQKEVVDILELNKRQIIDMPPRSGKTKIVIEFAIKHGIRNILFVTTSKTLYKGIQSEFELWGGNKINVMKMTWTSLHKVRGFFDMIVLDECQKITARNSHTLLDKKLDAKTIIAMTGTLSKDIEKSNLYSVLNLYVAYSKSIKEFSELGILSKYVIHKHLYEGTEQEYKELERIEKKIKITELKSWKNKRYNYLCNLDSKFNEVKNMLKELAMTDDSVVVFTPNVAISDRISHKYSYNNTTDDTALENFNNKKYRLLILVDLAGIGFTFKRDINHIFIMCCNSDRNGDIAQKVCRGMLNTNAELHLHFFVLKGSKIDNVFFDLSTKRLL